MAACYEDHMFLLPLRLHTATSVHGIWGSGVEEDLSNSNQSKVVNVKAWFVFNPKNLDMSKSRKKIQYFPKCLKYVLLRWDFYDIKLAILKWTIGSTEYIKGVVQTCV